MLETHISCSVFFFKLHSLLYNVEKYCRAGQARDDDIIWRMRIKCWVPKATNTHSDCVMLTASR
jgi:hypothetical protein